MFSVFVPLALDVVDDLATPKKLPVVTSATPLVLTAVVVSAAATAVVSVLELDAVDVVDVVTAAAAAIASTVADVLEVVAGVLELVVVSATVMMVGVCIVITLPPG